MIEPIVRVRGLVKRYGNGFEALKGMDLDIEEGEILALLGPNGAGKTTLISAICGITTPTEGTITVGGHDTVRDFRAARALIGLVPQETNLEPFEPVASTVAFSRGLFGKPRDPKLIARVLESLSLGDKAKARVRELSGGMKRRVLIAKALSHEPCVLFLDEPTAGVDVELRRGMWEIVAGLKRQGVTIILTTHYIEEAEAIADRIAVIDGGRILLVEEKAALMARMGQKALHVALTSKLEAIPETLSAYDLALSEDRHNLVYTYDMRAARTGVVRLLAAIDAAGLQVADVTTRESSLEEIFVGLTRHDPAGDAA